MSPEHFRILDLPPEIREKIYIFLCSNPKTYTALDRPGTHVSFPHNMLLTNAQIYQEIRSLYFVHNAFSITIRSRNDDLAHVLAPPFRDNRRQIRHLRICIVRWGSKNYFCESIAPMTEDMILNGRLRVLEVLVSNTFLKTWDVVFGAGEGYDNWTTVNRICKDPYLERVGLWTAKSVDAVREMDVREMEKGRNRQQVTFLLGNGLDTHRREGRLPALGKICAI